MNRITFRGNRVRLAALVVLTTSIVVTAISSAQEPDAEDESKMTMQLKLDYAANACKSQAESEYYQRGELAHVETEITNEDCAASHGSYTVKIRFRGDDQEIQNIEYPETWSRDDDLPIAREKEYFVAEDVDILRVRVRDLKCECVVSEEQDSATDENP